MDSLTQIVLGAAVGEAVLGKSLGNRALLWGAVGGTIPDLDVIPGIWMDTAANLAFHRGPSHSILFCLLSPLLFSGLARWFYQLTFYQNRGYKWFQTILALLVPILPAILLLYGLSSGALNWPLLVPVVLLFVLSFVIWRYFYDNYIHSHLVVEDVSYWRWYAMFALCLLTHVTLDACTTYGTQLFLPFSDYRVSWDIINVIDPLYTLPLLFCLFVVLFIDKLDDRRKWWNYTGLGVSSIYLLLCLYHKDVVHNKFEATLVDNNIDSRRYMCTPTPFNNILWYCLCETADAFETAHISMLDDKDRSVCLQSFPKMDQPMPNVSAVAILHWFSNGYLFIENINPQKWTLTDLRFGHFDFDCEGQRSPGAFRFKLEKEVTTGDWHFEQQDFEMNNISETWMAFKARLIGE